MKIQHSLTSTVIVNFTKVRSPANISNELLGGESLSSKAPACESDFERISWFPRGIILK